MRLLFIVSTEHATARGQGRARTSRGRDCCSGSSSSTGVSTPRLAVPGPAAAAATTTMPAAARNPPRSGCSGSGGGGGGKRRAGRPSFASVLVTASVAFFWTSSSRPPCLAQAASADSSSRGSFLAAGPPFSLERRYRQGGYGAGVGGGSAGAIRSLVSDAARGYDRHVPQQHQQGRPVDGPWGTRKGIVGGGAGGGAVTLRGGGAGRRAWFTGYEDTTQGETSSEEG